MRKEEGGMYKGKSISFRTEKLHLDTGEIIPAVVRCVSGAPLEILPHKYLADIVLQENLHIALARCDPHVHGRKGYFPSEKEYDEHKVPTDLPYNKLIEEIWAHNLKYDILQLSLSALKSGVWLLGCMGNVPWPPVGNYRWREIQELYGPSNPSSLVFMHVWPKMDPWADPVIGQEAKDFGTTFGGQELTDDERSAMYRRYSGECVRYHNDTEPPISFQEFKERSSCLPEILFHLYYGALILETQRNRIGLAREFGLKSLTTCHISTGEALQMIIDEREKSAIGPILPIEIGLDYLYWNYHWLCNDSLAMTNYRRPAFPSAKGQKELIDVLKKLTFDEQTMLASDHAPHNLPEKTFKPDGTPGAPGTRLLELSHQLHIFMHRQLGFSLQGIDNLAAKHPVNYMARYMDFPFPAGMMETGAMANLCIFSTDEPYQVNENRLRREIQDPSYHSAYCDEPLRGKMHYTIVNGRVWDVSGSPCPLN